MFCFIPVFKSCYLQDLVLILMPEVFWGGEIWSLSLSECCRMIKSLKVLDKTIKVHDLIWLVDMRNLWETKLVLWKYLLCMKCVSQLILICHILGTRAGERQEVSTSRETRPSPPPLLFSWNAPSTPQTPSVFIYNVNFYGHFRSRLTLRFGINSHITVVLDIWLWFDFEDNRTLRMQMF